MLEGEGECPERGPGSSYRAVGGRRLQWRVGEGLMGDVAFENGRDRWAGFQRQGHTAGHGNNRSKGAEQDGHCRAGESRRSPEQHSSPPL